MLAYKLDVGAGRRVDGVVDAVLSLLVALGFDFGLLLLFHLVKTKLAVHVAHQIKVVV
jgi:hypothetical protein